MNDDAYLAQFGYDPGEDSDAVKKLIQRFSSEGSNPNSAHDGYDHTTNEALLKSRQTLLERFTSNSKETTPSPTVETLDRIEILKSKGFKVYTVFKSRPTNGEH